MELVAFDASLAGEEPLDPVRQSGPWQRLREREMARAVNGAPGWGLPCDRLSKRQRRLVAAVSELPEPFGGHQELNGARFGRHLSALRCRLDYLVHLEERYGDCQRDAHPNRIERNALIFVLSEQADRAGIEAARPVPQPGAKYDRSYIEHVEDTAKSAIEAGYVLTDVDKPGLLMHRDGEAMPPLNVSVSSWFAVRASVRGMESDAEPKLQPAC